MMRRIGVLLLGAVTLCVAASACRKIPSGPQQPLKTEPIQSPVAIPTEYGNLIAVTSSSPNWALLWFEKPDKTIVVVAVNFTPGNAGLADEITLIPRN